MSKQEEHDSFWMRIFPISVSCATDRKHNHYENLIHDFLKCFNVIFKRSCSYQVDHEQNLNEVKGNELSLIHVQSNKNYDVKDSSNKEYIIEQCTKYLIKAIYSKHVVKTFHKSFIKLILIDFKMKWNISHHVNNT